MQVPPMNGPPMNQQPMINTAGPMIGPSPNLPPMGPYGFMPIIRKPDFPQDMQGVFVIPQIGFVQFVEKTKCRSYDPVLSKGVNSDWIIDRMEESWEHEERLTNLKPMLSSKQQKQQEKIQKHKHFLSDQLMKWNPFEDQKIIGDPFKTLFVSRLNYITTEKKLRKEFGDYGNIKNIAIVKNGEQSCGYAFIDYYLEYEHKNDMKTAYKYANGKRIDGKRVLVDMERGRTILNWRPRRLGQGLGDTRRSKSEEERYQKEHEEEEPNGEVEQSVESEKVKAKSRSKSKKKSLSHDKHIKKHRHYHKQEDLHEEHYKKKKHGKERSRSRSVDKKKSKKYHEMEQDKIDDRKKDKKQKKHKKKHQDDMIQDNYNKEQDNLMDDEIDHKLRDKKKKKKTSEKKKKKKD